jgi:phenylalanyl-tRNA synthetase beta chain
MKASLKWLKEFVDFSLSASELANSLTMAGLEVEDIERFDDDYVLEVNVTPNRPDCLSIVGIAREISAILDLPFRYNPVSIKKEEGEAPSIQVKDHNLCPRYSSRIITGVNVKTSPEWIQKRLESHGIRPVNNIVDITNYVLLEIGHPLHAFDLDRLAGRCIVVKTAGETREFLTLDNQTRRLNKEMLLIWDAEKPVAVAGVMGGLDSEVTGSTVNILLESAYFSPTSIRRTSKALNLITESSYRFERGADINIVVEALNKAAQLIVQYAGGKISRLTDVYPQPFTSKSIYVKFEKINDILGVRLDPTRVQKMLTSLGIENRAEGEGMVITPPSFRQDIQMDVDVIEEIARLYGYSEIPSTLPETRMQPFVKNTKWEFTGKIKESMIRSGFSEVINYSFLNPLVLDRLRIPSGDKRRNLVRIRNPLKRDENALRTTLIPALLENVRYNTSRGERTLRLFEVSSVFIPSSGNLPDEVLKMSAVYLRDKRPSLCQHNHDAFYELKGAVENLFHDLKIRDYLFKQEPSLNEPYLHPGKSCMIKVNDEIVGFVGSLHPEVAHDFEVPTETNILEMDLERLLHYIPTKITFQAIPKYPYIERDIAIVVSKDVAIADAERSILNTGSEIIESVRLFDIYTGKPIPEGKKSLAFSIRYRAKDRTLTDEEVNQVHEEIIKRLEKDLRAELRS